MEVENLLSDMELIFSLHFYYNNVPFYYGTIHVESCQALCSHDFSVLFSIVITSCREEGAGLWSSRAFVCLFCKR